MTRILFFLAALALAACGTTHQQRVIDNQQGITDFSNRAVVYTWIGGDFFKNRSYYEIDYFVMQSFDEAQDSRQYSMAWEKMGDGFLFWHAGFEPGLYRFQVTQTSFEITGVGIRRTKLTFRPNPLHARVRVSGPGVVFVGCYVSENTSGLFEPAKFITRRSICGVSRREMLAKLLDHTSKFRDPRPAQRVREAIR